MLQQASETNGSWYNTRTNPPPALSRVLKDLKAVSRRRPLGNRSEVIGRIASADRTYAKDTAAANNAFRFIESQGVILKDEESGKYYYDPDQAERLLAACQENRAVPPPEAPYADRLARLMTPPAKPDETEELPEATAEAETLPAESRFDELSDEALDRMTAPDKVPVAKIAEIMATDPMTDFLPVAQPSPPAHEIAPFEYALCLTPIEMDIWACVVALAKKRDQTWRLAAPMSSERLHERWSASRLDCDESDYFAAFRRFVDYNVLNEIGDTCDDQKTYAIGFDPSSRRTVPIAERTESMVSEEQFRIIRAIQRGEVRTPLDEPVAVAYGIVETDPEGGKPRVFMRGFERSELVSPSMRQQAPEPIKPTRPATPARPKAASTPPKESRVEPEKRLTTQRDELRKRIERAQADIAAWTGQIETIEAELAQLKDSKRQDLLKKKAEIERMLAALEEA